MTSNKYSIYTSFYNVENGLFDYKEAIRNFLDVADEVVVATNDVANKNTFDAVCSAFPNEILGERLHVVSCNYSFENPDFDGFLKNAALQKCTGNFASLLDLDERINTYHADRFRSYGISLLASHYDAFFIPVVNLYGDEAHAENISFKWYIHKVNKTLKRGVVDFAKRQGNKFDISKSDSTELITTSGHLANGVFLFDPSKSDDEKAKIIKERLLPVVFHLGGLNIENRKKQDEFWAPVWDNRSHTGTSERKDYSSIRTFEHGLGGWK